MLLALVNESGGKGLVEKIRMSTLARRCNLTEERARGIVRDLRTWGLVESEYREDPKTKRQVSNAYRLKRERMFPKSTGAETGETVGLKIWGGFLEALTELRGETEIYLLKNQIREAYFDASDRATKTAQRRGVLYLIASTDVVNQAFKENLRWILKLRDCVKPYLVDYVELVKRIDIPEE
jgi:hypothetical protein